MELIPGAEYEVTSVAQSYPEKTFKVRFLRESENKRSSERFTCEITHYVTPHYDIGQKLDLGIERFVKLVKPIENNEEALHLLLGGEN